MDTETSQEELVTVYSNWGSPVLLKEKQQQVSSSYTSIANYSTRGVSLEWSQIKSTTTIPRFYPPIQSTVIETAQPCT